MLSKLIKYDFKSTSRIMFPLYIALFVFALGTKLFLAIPSGGSPFDSVFGVMRGMFIFLYVISVIGIVIGCFIVVIMRFYKNLTSDEGYLSHTLPVTANAHLTSKLISGSVWVILTVLAVFLSVLLLFVGQITSADLEEIRLSLRIITRELAGFFGISGSALWVSVIFFMLLQVVSQLTTIYLCISSGQLFQGHRVLGSFVMYFGLYFVEQILFSIPIFFIVGRSVSQGTDYNITGGIQAMYWVYIALTAIVTVLSYLGTKFLLTKKLNLE